MPQKFFRLLTITLLTAVAIALNMDPPWALSQGGGPTPRQPGSLLDAVQRGRWPAQVVSSTGAVGPNVHGPQRTDPSEGIPKHAYSPFDERNNREHPCPPNGCEFAKGRVLIKFNSQVSLQSTKSPGALTADSAVNTTLAASGIVRLEPIFSNAQAPKNNEMVVSPQGQRLLKPDLTRWYRATLQDETADVYATVQSLAAAPGIASVEPDYLRKPVGEPALAAPNDPLYSQQWHLTAINAPQAWAYLESLGLPAGGRRDIVVAVIDTGVDYNHPDLAANLWTNSREVAGNGVDDDGNGFVDDVHGATVVSGQRSGNPMDDHGHGTHVAGIIAAQANNGTGGVGVAYNVQVMAIKAAQYSGVLASSDIAAGINYAVAQGADIINMSFGGYARSQIEEDALAVAFGQAVLVAAAGNDGKVNLPCPFGRDMYPAAYNWVLGVMASTSTGGLAGFSNYDCIPHDTHEYELMAPGVDVWSTLPNGQYAAWDGTSMAAPIVSGIAALVRTKFSDKDVYSSRFIMGQIAANASPIANAYAALTVAPKPELSYLEHWTFDTALQSPSNDNDGIVDAGETIDLAIVIRNHWGKADPVTVTLQAWAEGAFQPDPFVTMITDTVNYGAVGSFNVDDNGLIYAGDVITGVRNPFRFTVPITAPNDHVIPFRLTMSARNGLDPTDTTIYSFQSRFNLIVQRGRELPRIISQNMTLTKDDFWIVPGQTLIEKGVTVTIKEGTQVQWGNPSPKCVYCDGSTPLIQVEGSLLVEGTYAEPVELFSSPILNGGRGKVRIDNFGVFTLKYARAKQPEMGYAGIYYGPNSIDHCYLYGDVYTYDSGFSLQGSPGTLTNSIIKYWQGINGFNPGKTNVNLFQATSAAGFLYFSRSEINNSVFLQNNAENRTWTAFFENGQDIMVL